VRSPALLLGCVLAALTCRPTTTRPPITPYPEAAGTEVRLPVPEATRRLAEQLRADSILPRTVRLRDGYLETGWFEARTGRPASGRPLGRGVVRIRAWADPARPGSSQLSVETLYRPLLDPSLPSRELERQVPREHPVAVKVVGVLRKLVDRYGGSPGPQTEAAPPRAGQPAQPDEGDQSDETDQPDEPQ
jgi:hypothetical protein